MPETADINDNKIFASFLFSQCVKSSELLLASVSALPQKNTSAQNKHLKFHTMS